MGSIATFTTSPLIRPRPCGLLFADGAQALPFQTMTARHGSSAIAGLPRSDVWSVAFDPVKSGRLYASVHEEALYVADDAGVSWRKEGLEGSIVYRMKFIPEAARR